MSWYNRYTAPISIYMREKPGHKSASWFGRMKKLALEQDYLEEIDKNRTDVLSTMFGDSGRFVVELKSPFLDQIKNDLEHEGYKIDLDKKIGYKKNILQNGAEKWTPIGLGKLIGRRFGEDALKQYSNADKYSIIFSKEAVDVARMSDHLGIESCHSPGGNYFDCALTEARIGGAVAYLVTTNGLQSIDLNETDIFADPDRDIPGIKPLSRLRLRRILNNDTGEDLAIPENRVYGNRAIEGFKETVMQVCRQRQQAILSKYQGEPRRGKFKIVGGSYQDTDSSKLVNNFFEDNADKRNLEADTENSQADVWEEELEAIHERYGGQLRYFGVHADVEDGDAGNPSIYSSCRLNIPFEWLGLAITEPPYENRKIKIEFIEKIKHVINITFDLYVDEVDIRDDYLEITFNTDVNNPDDVAELYRGCVAEERKLPRYCQLMRQDFIEITEALNELGGQVVTNETPSKFNGVYFNHIQLQDTDEHDFIKISTFFVISPEVNQNRAMQNAIRKILTYELIDPLGRAETYEENTLFGIESKTTTPITYQSIEFTAVGKVTVEILLHKYINDITTRHVYNILRELDQNYERIHGEINHMAAKFSIQPQTPVTPQPYLQQQSPQLPFQQQPEPIITKNKLEYTK